MSNRRFVIYENSYKRNSHIKVKGYIDEYGHAKVDLTIAGRRADIPISATIDTGFDGDICLPIQVALQLGLELWSTIEVELADGSRKSELLFLGLIAFGEERREVWITLTQSKDALIGTEMFSYLEISFPDKKVIVK